MRFYQASLAFKEMMGSKYKLPIILVLTLVVASYRTAKLYF